MIPDRVDEGHDEVMTVFNDGVQLYEQGRVDEAIFTIKRIYEANPSNHAVKTYLFTCHFQQGFNSFTKADLDGAIGHFESAYAILPDHEQTRLNLTILYNQKGTELYEGGKAHEAAPVFMQALDLVAENPIAKNYLFAYHFGFALKLIEVQDYDGAIEHLEQANSLVAGHEQASRSLGLLYNQKGSSLFGQGKIKEAMHCFERSVAFTPGNTIAANYLFSGHFHLGVDLAGRQDMDGALRHFEAAFAHCPTHKVKRRDLVFHTYQLGTAHFAKKEYDDAIRYFKQAAAVKLDNEEVDGGVLKNIHLFWWISAIQADRQEDYIQFCMEILVNIPVSWENSEWMVTSCREVGAILHNYCGYAEAIPFFLRVLSIHPSDVGAHNSLGICFLACNDYIKGIRHFSLSMKCDPSQTDAPYRVSQILMLMKGPETAEKFCDHVLRKRPGNIIVMKERASIRQFAGAGPNFPYYPFPKYNADQPAWSNIQGGGRKLARSREKVRILCFGPCQGFGISRTLEALLKPVADASIFYINTGQLHLSEIMIRKYAKYADVAVFRKLTSSSAPPEEIQAYAALNEELPSDCLKISFPAMENWGLWPINIFSNRVDTSKSVQELLRSGCAINDILQAYDAGDLDFDFSKRFRESMAIMKFTERYTDIKVHDYINEHVKDKILFTYGAHPAKSLYIECVRQIYERMFNENLIGIPLAEDGLSIYESWPDDVIHPAEFFPVDKYSHKHFGFTWCSAESAHGSARYYHMLLQMARNLMLGAFRK